MLTPKQEKLASIASYTAVSDVANLAQELTAGLEAGLTINEIKEVFTQLCAYCGFPRGLRGIDTFMDVLLERQARGIQDVAGREPSPVTDTRSYYDRGEAVQMAVTGWSKEKLRAGAMGFIPKIDVQLKHYIFADIYDSDVLSYSDREIATVAAQLSMDGIEPQIQAHINAAFQVGLNEAQVRHIIAIIEREFGPAKGDRGRALLANVLAARTTK
ncbi:Carboxymuconolactone decarboxylase family protein [Hymenobacter gelipurpurascens]|uniref:Carboxymuconolactone decarboxylase family protein n=1 Tax=Hymenobacter gelipurpurascens TaxID=89968 RepID=A0A212TGU6_9BACT|nr:carboxymuconolactone decarboxylase family protein [Hymenobacter gelipurpurascens]SNC65223.1 Carboxymuconolactone decarboxylase family protein [Hymenobacter gelipurpurascens]